MVEPDGWDEWGRHVLKELERLNDCYESVRKEMTRFGMEVATLKVKAGLWGAAGAAIPVIAFLLIEELRNK